MSLAAGILVALRLTDRPFVVAAYRRGRRSAWLPAADWEGLLEMPLGDVRGLLGLGKPQVYGEVRTDRSSVAA